MSDSIMEATLRGFARALSKALVDCYSASTRAYVLSVFLSLLFQ
jgi:hypothetical protein